MRKLFTLLIAVALALQAYAGVVYSEDFEGKVTPEGYRSYSKSGFGGTWSINSNSEYYSDGRFATYYNGSIDVYLHTCGIKLKGNSEYTLKYKSYLEGTNAPTNINVYVVNDNSQNYITALTPESSEYINSSNTVTIGKNNENYDEFEFTFQVPRTGVYYLVFEATGTQKGSDWIFLDDILVEGELPPGVPQAMSDLGAVAAPLGEMKVVLSWTNPTLDSNNELMTKLEKVVIENGERKIELTDDNYLSAGASITYNDILPSGSEAGTYTYKIYGYLNSEPGTDASVTSNWVGIDIPQRVSTANSKLQEGSKQNVILTWEAPTQGQHSGYLDISKYAYRITRDGETIASNLKTTTYTDSDEKEYKSHSYYVYITGEDGEDVPGTSGAYTSITCGGAYNLPYSDDFSDYNKFSICTKIGSPAWTRYSYGDPYAYVSLSSGLDSWLILPPLKLEKGVPYQLDFAAFGGYVTTYSQYFGNLSVYCGNGNTKEEMTILIADGFDVKNSSKEAKEFVFTVPEDGEYYIGFHGVLGEGASASSSYSIQIDDVNIDKIEISPLAPEELTAVAKPEGEMAVELSWKNPTKANTGSELQANLSKIEIYRNSDEQPAVTLIDEQYLAPGAEVKYTDNLPESASAGFYTYTIKPYIGENTKDFAQIKTSWVGADELNNVTELLAVADDNDNVTLTFTSPTGKNGGYVDLSRLKYKVTRKSSNDATEKTLTESLAGTETSYTDETLEELDKYTYYVYNIFDGVTATSGTMSSSVVAGGTAALPYSNTFDKSADTDLFTAYNNIGSNNWRNSSSAYAHFEGANTASPKETDAWTLSPRFEFEPGHDYRVTFDLYNESSDPARARNLEVYIKKNREDEGQLIFSQETVNWPNSADASQKFQEVFFNVDEPGKYHVALRTHGTLTHNSDIFVDNLTVENYDTAPAVVTDLTVQPAANGQLAATLSWTNPTQDNKYNDLENISKVVISRDGTQIAELSDAQYLGVGENVTWTDENVDEEGYHAYSIVLWDQNPGRAATVENIWIGNDVMIEEVSNVKIQISSENIDWAELYFDLPVGEHGGWIDLSDVAYKIVRQNGTDSKVVETAWSGELPYVDKTLNGIGKYFYTVYVNDSEKGVSSPAAVLGGVYEIPYKNTFSMAEADLITMEQVGEEGCWSITSAYEQLRTNATQNKTLDTWAYLPAIKLEGGKEYKFTFNSWNTAAGNAYHRLPLAIYAATSTDKEELQANCIFEETILSTSSSGSDNFYQCIMNVEETGYYYIAFRSYGRFTVSGYPWLYVDNFEIVETGAPAIVTNITVLNTEEGRVISFDAVDKTAEGEPLEGDVTYNIYLNDKLIASDVEETTYTDTTEFELQNCTYSVNAICNGKIGLIGYAQSIVCGSPLSLPYRPDFSNGDFAEIWSFFNDGTHTQIGWGYNSGYNGLYNGGWDGTWAVTPPFKAVEGTLKLNLSTYRNTSTSEQLRIALFNNINDRSQRLQEYLYEYPKDAKVTDDLVYLFDIPSDGVYYIGFEDPNYNNGLAITHTAISQSHYSLPYTADFTDTDEVGDWSFVNKMNADNNWMHHADGYIHTEHQHSWAITPSFDLTEGNMCLISPEFEVLESSSSNQQLGVYLISDLNDLENAELLGGKTVQSGSARSASGDDILFEVKESGRFWIGFKKVTDESSEWRLKNLYIESDNTTSVADLKYVSDLGYSRSIQSILLPSAGRLEVYSLNGTAVVSVETSDYRVNVSSLAAGTYIARFYDEQGHVSTLKFVK